MSGMQQMMLGSGKPTSSWKLQGAWASNLQTTDFVDAALPRTPQINEIIVAVFGYAVDATLGPSNSEITDDTGATGAWIALTGIDANGGFIAASSAGVLRRIAYKVCTSAGTGGVTVTTWGTPAPTHYLTVGLFSVNSPVGLAALNYQHQGTLTNWNPPSGNPANPTALTPFVSGPNSLCILDVWYPNAGTHTQNAQWLTAWEGPGAPVQPATDFVGYTTLQQASIVPAVSFGSGVCYFVTNCVEFHLP